MGSCRMLPHGSYALCAAVFSTLAWFASLFQDGCDFARLTGPMVENISLKVDVPYLEVGFGAFRAPTFSNGSWQTSYNSKCQPYPSDLVNVDGYWKSAKAFAFLALVLGGGGTLFLWFSTCFVFAKGTWRWAGYEVLLASIFQAFSFLWFGTQICHNQGSNCSLFWGSRADIVATVFWFVTALAIFAKYPVPKTGYGEDDDGDGAAAFDHENRNNNNPDMMLPPPPPTAMDGHHDDYNDNDKRHDSSNLSDVPLEGDASARLAGHDDGSSLPYHDRTEPEVV